MLEKHKILVVDDQVGVRMLLNEALIDAGFYVETAANGYEALEKLNSFSPDLILMDVKMPIMGGVATLAKMAEQGIIVKTILMTAYGEGEMVEQAKLFGISDYIAKPFDIDHVREKILKILA